MVPVAVPEMSALRVVLRGAGPLAGVGVRATARVSPPVTVTIACPWAAGAVPRSPMTLAVKVLAVA
jgi:hypothetical protein